jgi:hemerythrin
MILVEWSKSLSVDAKAIDQQHKKLLGYMNYLYEALTQKKEKEILEELFRNLEDYTHTHFALEEAYFKKFGYKNTEGHILQHKEFIRRLADMKKQYLKRLWTLKTCLDFL